ncbi:chromosome partitioning protein, ParB family [Desulfonispora thiosulfatigenes DSM 11270]|uniref:Chromosome partitioning protein, ParB family n=1 Tax=Desulfonispora thiosulfatigenes DSM 11270 TaxID=656914 RepID=A0A1W1V2K9_DESTI|nr:ParB/RepB/Spo0J family partition protein [Desulfonispora thiosulfatigenes]SMB87565.1 chromosome partitioning protein, ParB family [Desulfonispora thiosulfatigenes DSM 11270]
MSTKRLGKGLGALLSDTDTSREDIENIKRGSSELKISSIKPNSFQPRKVFDPEKLNELMLSIKEHGVVQPIVVRTIDQGYELVVGERRLRACKKLGFTHIPAIIKDYNDEKMMEVALIENIQRHNLNPVEEANAYKSLIEIYNFSQEDLAKKVGKSRPYISNFLRLLNLPDNILNLLAENKISVGHARSLLSLEDPNSQIEIVQRIIDEQLSVRQTENIIKKLLNNEHKKSAKNTNEPSSPIISDFQDKLRSKFGTKVLIKEKGDNGKIEIEFYNQSDLQRILELILDSEF